MITIKRLAVSMMFSIRAFLKANPGATINPTWIQQPTPQPRPGNSGVAAAKRAALKSRNRAKARRSLRHA